MTSNSKVAIERVVVLLSPFFLAAGTWLAGIIASNVPFGPQVTGQDIEGVMIAAFVSLAALVFKWLHGRQIPAIAGIDTQAVESNVVSIVEKILANRVPDPPVEPVITPGEIVSLVQNEVGAAFTRAAGGGSPTPTT